MSLSLPGASTNDLLNSQNNWMKSIALERHFLLTLCCCRQKVSRIAGMLFEKSHGGWWALAHALIWYEKKHASRHRPARRPLDGFCLEFLRIRYSFSTAKKSIQKMPLAAKVFNHTKRFILWAPTALSLQRCPSNFRSNGFPRGVRLPFAPKISLFVLKI
jgi:hypothetical protein